MPRGGDRAKAAVLVTVGGQNDRGRVTLGTRAGSKPLCPIGVVAMTVGEQDDANATSLLGSAAHCTEMSLVVRPRIDYQARPRPI
jgi:hypothetical protein